MDLRILDPSFNVVTVLDAFKSLVWTDRYWECGEFELFTEVNPSIMTKIKEDYYIVLRSSKSTMIVEDIEIETDTEEGDYIRITGRSLESILDRRIIWGLRSYNGNLQNCIEALLKENVISPSDSKRKISNFIFERSTDPTITSLTIDKQWTGDNLYDSIVEICKAYEIGFRIVLNNNNQFVFKLYNGVDRTYDQSDNPYVTFSPKFENLANSNYYQSNSLWKNITLIGGEGEGKDRKYTTYRTSDESGLQRREIFTDARDISLHDYDTDKDIPLAEYNSKLQARGKEKLADYIKIRSFEGEVEATIMFKYGEHFFTGDIVQIKNEYGITGETRIIEFVTSQDDNGYHVYPTFSMI